MTASRIVSATLSQATPGVGQSITLMASIVAGDAPSTVTVSVTDQEPVTLNFTPVTDPVPDDVTSIRIGAASYPVSGVDPPASKYPNNPSWAGRGPNDLVIYTPAAGAFTLTNRWGAEASLLGGQPTLFVDRQATGGPGIAIPAGGYVVSAHGAARLWMLTHLRPGVKVELSAEPVPTDRASNIAAWVMMWPNSPRFDWAAIPDEVDELRLAFLINDGDPVGDGPWGVDSAGVPRVRGYIRDFLARRPGRFVSWSMGGGGYEVEIPSIRAYVVAVSEAERRWLPEGVKFGGANVDWESPRFRGSGDQIAEVLRAARVDRPDLFCSWSPNGSWKAAYASVCARNPDVVDAVGFQCYDIPGLTIDQALKVYREHFSADVFDGKLEVAYASEAGRTDRWTVSQCVAAASRMRDEFGVRRAAFWEAGRPEFGAWVQGMQVLRSP